MVKGFVFALAASAVLLSAAPVLAQPVPETSAPQAAGPMRGRMQHRLQALHDRLGITPAQQPQWDAVMATLRENMQALRASPAVQAMRSGQLTGVQALRAGADVARQRADGMQRMIPPVESLYGTLSPEQRQVADREIGKMLHLGGPRRG